MSTPNFKGVQEDMYCPLTLVKDLAQASPSLQFLVMSQCEGGFVLQEGAFGPPQPEVKGQYFTYPNKNKTLIVLLHVGVEWNLLVPIKGREEEFW